MLRGDIRSYSGLDIKEDISGVWQPGLNRPGRSSNDNYHCFRLTAGR